MRPVPIAATGDELSGTWTPERPGLYGVDITVSALAADGSRIERSSFLAVEVVVPLARSRARGALLLVAVVGLLGALSFGWIRRRWRRGRALAAPDEGGAAT